MCRPSHHLLPDSSRRQLYVATLRGELSCFRDALGGGVGGGAGGGAGGDANRSSPFIMSSFSNAAWRFHTPQRTAPPRSESGRTAGGGGGCAAIFGSPALTAEGDVVFGSVDGVLRALSPQGESRWTFDAGGAIFSAIALARIRLPLPARTGGHLEHTSHSPPECAFFTSQGGGGKLFCVDLSTGSCRWQFGAHLTGHSAPTLDVAPQSGCEVNNKMYTSRVVAVGGVDGSLHVMRAADGEELAREMLPEAIFSSAVLCSAHLVVGCRDDRLYCLRLSADDG